MFRGLGGTCVEIKVLRRVRAESSRRPARHRRDTCSMAWVMSVPHRSTPDALVDFHTGGRAAQKKGDRLVRPHREISRAAVHLGRPRGVLGGHAPGTMLRRVHADAVR